MPLLFRPARVAVPTIAFAVATAANADIKQIKLDTMSGPNVQIWGVVQKVAKKDGLDVKTIESNDYAQPNPALDSGDLDANGFQHQPFLDSQVQARRYEIVNVGLTYVAPMGFYSKETKSLAQLKEGAKTGIQNDPSNGSRALLLLQEVGVIKLKADAGTNGNNATLRDVVEDPKKIKLIELDSAQLPRSLDDLDAASTNTDYTAKNGLMPTKDAIALGDRQGSYANLIAVREKDKDQSWVKTLVRACQSGDVRKFTGMQLKGAILSAF